MSEHDPAFPELKKGRIRDMTIDGYHAVDFNTAAGLTKLDLFAAIMKAAYIIRRGGCADAFAIKQAESLHSTRSTRRRGDERERSGVPVRM